MRTQDLLQRTYQEAIQRVKQLESQVETEHERKIFAQRDLQNALVKLDKIKEYIKEVIIVDDTGTTLLFKEEVDKLLSIIDKEQKL